MTEKKEPRDREESNWHTSRSPLPEEPTDRSATVLRYALAAIVTYLLALLLGYALIPSWYALPAAAVPLLLALVLHNLRFPGSFRYALTVPLNAAAAGLAASAYFRALALPLPYDSVLLGALMLFLLLIPAKLLSARFETPRQQKIIAGVSLFIFLAALVALIVLWCTHPREEIVYALMTFHLVFFGFYYLAFFVAATDDDKDVGRLVSFWSFSLALSVALVAAVALLAVAGGDGCDCDCGDGCDCFDCHSDGKRKSKKK